MNRHPIKIGIGGSHSTGKTSFLNSLEAGLEHSRLRIHRIGNLAKNARDLGFPILTEHTYESTLWIMSEGMRLEAEATLKSDVILIDRPVFDAVGYYEAALQISGRKGSARDLQEVRAIAFAHFGAYDLVFGTELDPTVALGENRDENENFRYAAATQIKAFLDEIPHGALKLTTTNVEQMLDHSIEMIKTRFSF
ncbi:MAG: AAA family ATPase [Rhizobiaceae bacterium]|nr:AAA family ATPase [Rhizobiaceae bacterium]